MYPDVGGEPAPPHCVTLETGTQRAEAWLVRVLVLVPLARGGQGGGGGEEGSGGGGLGGRGGGEEGAAT